MQISKWVTHFNGKVIRNEERPDNPGGDTVYRVKEVFTTRDGSWDWSDKAGAIEPWARERYLLPPSDPAYFDDAGGDHHLFARLLDEQGNPLTNPESVICWSDGIHLLENANFASFIKMTITPKPKSGWGNQPIWSSFSPQRGETGPWAWCPRGAADVVVGGGLPDNLHVSWFVVWQAEKRNVENPTSPTAEIVRQTAWHATGLALSPTTAFALYASQHSLGAPLTVETDVAGYRVQGFANGIVYAPIDRWDQASHISW